MAKKTRFRIVILIFLVLAIAGGGGYWWRHRNIISTDNAYLGADIITISAEIDGRIESVAVDDNAPVQQGDILVRLDDAIWIARRDAAKAVLAAAESDILAQDSKIAAQLARIDQSHAEKSARTAMNSMARDEQQRTARLKREGYAPTAKLDTANSIVAQSSAEVLAAGALETLSEKELASLKQQRETLMAKRDQAKADLIRAETDLLHTVIRAPFDGYVGNRTAATGQWARAGMGLMRIVPAKESYLIANFKENQIGRLRPGDKAEIRLDAWPKDRIEGEVTAISPAAGSVYSLLPPENATGNFTRIVQRVPVRIRLPKDPEWVARYRPGLSARVDVTVSQK